MMVRKEKIDICIICGVAIDNSYRKSRFICGSLDCLRKRRRIYKIKIITKLKKEHKCYTCRRPVKLVKPKPYYPTRCSNCRKIVNLKNNTKKGESKQC